MRISCARKDKATYKGRVYCKLLFNCMACPTLAPLDTNFIAHYGQHNTGMR